MEIDIDGAKAVLAFWGVLAFIIAFAVWNFMLLAIVAVIIFGLGILVAVSLSIYDEVVSYKRYSKERR
jgi:hypothetical protein